MTDYEAAFWKLKNNWDESVKHYEDRIEKLEKNVEDWQRMYREAVIQKEMIFRHQYDLIEKLETALRHIEMEAPRGSFFNDVARKALEGKDD